MFDCGTFNHMFGTSLVSTGCVINLRKVKPLPCRIAKGFMWLDTKGDAMLPGGLVLRDGYINPHNDITLISDGKLALLEAREFDKNVSGLAVSEPRRGSSAGGSVRAFQQGVLFYLPKNMMPEPAALTPAPSSSSTVLRTRCILIHSIKKQLWVCHLTRQLCFGCSSTSASA
jgi:hypothetical protein